jgi:hypothetical protein
MKQSNRSIHVNARIHPKMNGNTQRKVLADLTSEYGISSTKSEIRKKPQMKRHSVQVQHIARKPSLSRDNRHTRSTEKTNAPWILKRFLRQNYMRSEETHLRNPSSIVENHGTVYFHPMEQASIGSLQNSKRNSSECASVCF